MGLLELFLIAVGLSMDAFAVSVCKGLSVRTLKAKHAVICGLYFGGFQLLMPLIGYALGVRFQSLITSIDHWIAFVLLGLIGANMVRESREHDDESVSDSFRFMTMLPLAVSGAFHTPLMAKAAAELRAYVADFTFSAPKMDIYSNLDGKVYDCSNLPAHLEQHMISPVRWTQLVKNGMAAGLTSACEIGPGKTLTGFAGKISKELTCKTVQDMAGVQAAAE